MNEMTPAPRERGAGGSQECLSCSVVGTATDQVLDLGDREDMTTDVADYAAEETEPDGADEGFEGCEQHWVFLM